jgi:glycosyltransferase involved in cell wall biosynthesis
MRLNIISEPSVTVITPTIGSPKLYDAIASVQNQSYKEVKHLLVVDGAEHYVKVCDALKLYDNVKRPSNLQIDILTNNTGKAGGNFYGHRIYAGYSHLISTDLVFFLDEDNWYESDHVESLAKLFMNPKIQLAHSYRKVFDENKNYICDDNCESLGAKKGWVGRHLIDTSSFAFRASYLVETGHAWHWGWGGDHRYLGAITNDFRVFDHIDCNYLHTLCYRLNGNDGSVTPQFFLEGNMRMENQ